jgi:hypothetical protein
MLGDVNGDNRDDAVVYFADTGSWYVALSDGTAFQGNLTPWVSGHGIGSSQQMLGDVNGDNRDDAVVYFTGDIDTYQSDTGTWYVADSDGAAFVARGSAWKQYHGVDTWYVDRVNMDRASSWQGLAPVRDRKWADPIAFWHEDGRWGVLPSESFLRPFDMQTWEAFGIDYGPIVAGTPQAYDSANDEIIDQHLRMISDAEIDFLILDLTNMVTQQPIFDNATALANRIHKWNAAGHRQLRFAAAVGGIQFSHAPSTFETEAQVVYETFLLSQSSPDTDYYTYLNRPLLIFYGEYSDRQMWERYSGDKTSSDRFTVRFAQGMPGSPPNAPPESDYGLYFGWTYTTGTLPNDDVMVVMPGCNNHFRPELTYVPRQNGEFYVSEGWQKVLQQMPHMVIINSFNEFAEQTAVEPADTRNVRDPTERWSWPSQYWDITVSANRAYKHP